MVDKSGLEALRAEALRQLTRSNRKVQRLARENGAFIAGTSMDPRKNVSSKSIARMSTPQLNAFIARSKSFTSRGTQYVGLGSGNSVIKKREWNSFKKAEARANQAKLERFNSIKDRLTPNGNETIEEHQNKLNKTSYYQVSPNDPRTPDNRTREQIRSAKALKSLKAKYERVANEGTDRAAKNVHMAISRMLRQADTKESRSIYRAYLKLNDEQRYALAHGTEFVSGAKWLYEGDDNDEVSTTYERQMRQAVTWAARNDTGTGRA